MTATDERPVGSLRRHRHRQNRHSPHCRSGECHWSPSLCHRRPHRRRRHHRLHRLQGQGLRCRRRDLLLHLLRLRGKCRHGHYFRRRLSHRRGIRHCPLWEYRLRHRRRCHHHLRWPQYPSAPTIASGAPATPAPSKPPEPPPLPDRPPPPPPKNEVAAIATNGEVGIECAVFDRETGHARIDRADIDRSAGAETSAASCTLRRRLLF